MAKLGFFDQKPWHWHTCDGDVISMKIPSGGKPEAEVRIEKWGVSGQLTYVLHDTNPHVWRNTIDGQAAPPLIDDALNAAHCLAEYNAQAQVVPLSDYWHCWDCKRQVHPRERACAECGWIRGSAIPESQP